MKLEEIAQKIGGVLEGSGDVEIAGLAGLHDAGPNDITFLANSKYASAVETTNAGAVLLGKDWEGSAPCTLVRVDDPDAAFAETAKLFAPPEIKYDPGVHETATISEEAELGENVSIGPYCVVCKGARIGSGTVLVANVYVGESTVIGSECLVYSNVTMRERCRIGDRVIIHPGAVIGSDGFGYVRKGEQWEKIPQVGYVELEDDVEIGSNVTIDRGRFGRTLVAKGAKIDNLVMIAHNVVVGENTAMAAQVGISGSTRIGRNVQLGGQAGLAGHLSVGDNSAVGAQGGVTKDVPPATYVTGYPAMPHKKAAKLHASMMRLPALKERIAELESKVLELEERLGKEK